MATEKVINTLATVLLLLLLSCLLAFNQVSVTALAVENPDESQTHSTDSNQTSYNASEPVVPAANHPNNASQKVVIDFDLPSAQQSSDQNGNRKKDDDGSTPILKLIINQLDGISVNATSTKMAATETSHTSAESDDALAVSPKETTTSQQQLLIPPASVNASIAQMPTPGGAHKQQGQIIIR